MKCRDVSSFPFGKPLDLHWHKKRIYHHYHHMFSFLLLFSFVESTYILWITEVEARDGTLVRQSGFETYPEF